MDILSRPAARSIFVVNESFHPELDDRFHLGKTSGKQTSQVVTERNKTWDDEGLNLAHGKDMEAMRLTGEISRLYDLLEVNERERNSEYLELKF